MSCRCSRGSARTQFLSAGLDWINLDAFPRGESPLLAGTGALGDAGSPCAEHALAMALAAAKRLLVEQRTAAQSCSSQFTPNKMLAGKVWGILGFGGVGIATAYLAQCIGMRVHAINRRERRTGSPAG